MAQLPICHMSNTPVAAELITVDPLDGTERAGCYACGRSVLVRAGRYAEHRQCRKVRARR